jgi:uncharacterized protein YbbK (DUF523 family)
MENILVSACLVGKNVKYNGLNNLNTNVLKLKEKYNFILICPEVEGGLSTPRTPAEVLNSKVINKDGKDVTKEYNLGARIALEKAIKYNCRIAILKEKSPSCGTRRYDGTFSHTLIDEPGICASLLIKNGIKVYGESELENLLK